MQQQKSSFAIPVDNGPDGLLDGLMNIPADAHVKGAWSSLKDFPVLAAHAAVMPNGKLLAYGTKEGLTDIQDGRTLVFWDTDKGYGDDSMIDRHGQRSRCGQLLFYGQLAVGRNVYCQRRLRGRRFLARDAPP